MRAWILELRKARNTNLINFGGGDLRPMCCGNEHGICKFAAGFLHCITHNCSNPHHRGNR